MVGPGENKLLTVKRPQPIRFKPLLQRHDMGHLLAGMGNSLHINDRHISVFCKGIQNFVFAILLPIGKFRESPDANHIAIARENFCRFFYVLLSLAIHDDAVFKFQRPHPTGR